MGHQYRDGGGDVNYGRLASTYSRYRQPDPAIAAFIRSFLGNARSVLNVGAGAGSYEPEDRKVTAVEPSASMRAERPIHFPEAIDAIAENLPFADGAFDASMAIFTVHQWADPGAGLLELRRVTQGPVLILTCEPQKLDRFWLNDYAPEVITTESRRYPATQDIAKKLGAHSVVKPVPIPLQCKDGFNEAYYGRPEMLLFPEARLACSSWSFLAPDAVERFQAHLIRDLKSGAWDKKYGYLRKQPTFEGSLTLIIGLL